MRGVILPGALGLLLKTLIYQHSWNSKYQKFERDCNSTPTLITVIGYWLMKKLLSRCADCAEDNLLLTQVSSGPEVILLCNDCYNLKYSKELQSEISYEDEKKS